MYKNNVNGMLLFDKPKGISSNYILQKVKKIFCAKKAGYIGTLDPLATGLLPICFGESTKFVEQINNSKKCYYVVAKLGEVTATYDSQGVILNTKKVQFSYLDLYSSLHILKKRIVQIVPIYSAIKYRGRALYKYARKNISIPKITRNIRIYKLRCIEYNNTFITLKITCSKGTYVRRLVHDLGVLLKCGAHVISLRRLRVSSYKITRAITLHQLNTVVKKYPSNISHHILLKFLIPVQALFFTLPEMICSDYNSIHDIKNRIYFFNSDTPKFFRITIQNNNKMFILGKINQIGQLILCKLLNI
ncbi:tRNA pseudouridine synthase B [Buchnera aphidicola (Takecallis arundicolens)]|uniref:tRNA pseudouridine(55) synthase TruB n=1 Tax=Buchnera aphidicola TaxID=9 RepID=UPI0034645676